MVFPLAKFAKDVSPVGMFTYPFSMQLPDWLPASIIFCSHIESAKLSINYSIQAQFTPSKENDFVDIKKEISLFRGSTNIYIFRPIAVFPPRELKFTLESEIGGFFGMGATHSKSEIIFDKNEYYIGHPARVKIICDNSQCNTAVRGFKFKLHRKHLGKDNSNWTTAYGDYISVLKAPGCPAREKVEREYTIDIPLADKFQGKIAD